MFWHASYLTTSMLSQNPHLQLWRKVHLAGLQVTCDDFSSLAADAVFESVAQVLLSCSRGLRSRFKQITMKADAEVGKK